MAIGRLTKAEKDLRIAQSVVLFAAGALSYGHDGWKWSPGWLSVILGFAPWIRWLLTFIFENFQTIKVAGIEVAVRATVSQINKVIPEFTMGGELREASEARILKLLPKVRAAESYLWLQIAQASDGDLDARRSISKLARKLGTVFLWRVLANHRQVAVPAFEGKEIESARAHHLMRIAVKYNRRSAYARNGLGAVLFMLGKWRQARLHLERAVALCSRSNRRAPDILYNLGLTYDSERSALHDQITAARRKRLQSEELSCYAEGIRRGGRNWSLHYNAAYMAAELSRPDALPYLNSAGQISGDRTRRELLKDADTDVFRRCLTALLENPNTQGTGEKLRDSLRDLGCVWA